MPSTSHTLQWPLEDHRSILTFFNSIDIDLSFQIQRCRGNRRQKNRKRRQDKTGTKRLKKLASSTIECVHDLVWISVGLKPNYIICFGFVFIFLLVGLSCHRFYFWLSEVFPRRSGFLGQDVQSSCSVSVQAIFVVLSSLVFAFFVNILFLFQEAC